MAVKSFGVEAPIIRQGDDLVKIVVDSVLKATKIGTVVEDSRVLGREVIAYDIHDKDVIGITESIVARAEGNYATLDEITDDIKKKFNNPREIVVVEPIYSRNRFSMILKAIARAASEKVFIFMPDYDEVGNPSGVNRFTGVNMIDYYAQLVENEGRECIIFNRNFEMQDVYAYAHIPTIYCKLHWDDLTRGLLQKYENRLSCTLCDICADKNSYFGLLGSNKATEEKLKLFPTREYCKKICDGVKERIREITGKNVIVGVYGDGCFKDPLGGIWEFADPVTMPYYTDPEIMESTPNEIKIKAFADDKYGNLNGKALERAIKDEIKEKDANLVGNMASQGTTPRKIYDLLASLMDLTSGSGDKGTPIVCVSGYFTNYSTK